MRERLIAAFVAITLLVLLGAGSVRAQASDEEIRRHERADVARGAVTVALVLGDTVEDGEAVDEALLGRFLGPGIRLAYAAPGAAPVVASGSGFAAEEGEAVSATRPVAGGGELTVTRLHDDDLEGVWGGEWTEILVLFTLLAIGAGGIGYAVARSLSAPFRQLAVAAAALGRGRFDLDLPRGGVPEARAIASALDLSAGQLKDRLEREREFALHASHVLRTPLTGLRLRLEELVDDPDLTVEARDAARSCLTAVADLNRAAGELVELGGRGVLVAGAAVPLRDLAAEVVRRWAERLGTDDRELTAAVEGDLELPFTPGPVEQVLDLLLDDVVAHESGPVRLVFEGAASRLRVDVSCAGGVPAGPVQQRVQAVLDAVGGRLDRPRDADVLRLHLPRR